MQPWTFEGKPFTEEEVGENYGFVYLITNLETGKRYIGKKWFWSSKTKPPLKGFKRKRRSKVPSSWPEYHGSSNELLADIELIGQDKFSRQVLLLCKTKGDCSYHEARLQFEHRVLEGDGWYNSYIGCRIHRSHISRQS